ncbi:beta-galactosidase [Caldicellulosiruptoraceae bacterium PP1]
MANIKLKEFLYGGDYNPDQWPEEILNEDIRLMKYFNVNAATFPVFSWAKLQPEEDRFDFEWLDKIINLLYENGIYTVLATPTAAQPAWLSKKYPEILPVDEYGRQRKHGARQNYCPNSPVMKEAVRRVAEEMAKHYKDHPSILLWHISNEYGPYCYCEKCEKAFREWLKDKYKTIENLNEKWYTSFWGRTFYDFDEIVVPSFLNEHVTLLGTVTCMQALSLDYNRFMSDSLLNLFKIEKESIRKYMPDTPITTNLMRDYKPLNYYKWAKEMDVVSWDCYPTIKDHPSSIAFQHDIMRGLKDGQPFLLMEQSPNQVNWQTYNSLKRPGVMRLYSYQAVAHGADSVMFFQWRQARGSAEKFHSAMVPHVMHENTRSGRELKQLGEELKKLNKIIDSKIDAKVAILFDWENWWALEYSLGPNNSIRYSQHVEYFYKSFFKKNIQVDIINPRSDLSKYSLIVAPLLYMMNEDISKKIEQYVASGGYLITTYLSGLVDENDLIVLGGYPGWLRKILGIWVEEIDSLYPDMKNSIIVNNPSLDFNGEFECSTICDVINLEGANVLATYGKDFYKNTPAVTENTFGNGKAVYIGTKPSEEFLDKLFDYYLNSLNIKPILYVPDGVEVTKRQYENVYFIFVINHNDYEIKINLDKEYYNMLSEQKISGEICLAAKDVLILTI